MSRLPRLPQRGRSGPWIVALGVALVIAIQPIWKDSIAVAVAGAVALTLIAATRWQLRWLPAIVLIGCGVALRLATYGTHASDVSDTTRAAIGVMLAGADPYGIGYAVSNPPGAAFPYGPVALLWYLPVWLDPPLMELFVSGVLLAWLGIRAANGRPIGLAIFALAPPLVLAATDGSNDTTAGLMILVALALAPRRPLLGAAALAVAVAFKPYAVAWVPALLLWAGLPALIGFAVASVIAWSPILFVWGPGSYLRSLSMAQETHLRQSYWSVAAVIDQFAPGMAPRALETARYFISGAVAVVGALRVKTLDGVIIVGAIAFVLAQFTGYFGSYVYLAAVAPLLCWRVDDWVRMGLPELVRAYGALPEVGRRVRRPAGVRIPAPSLRAPVPTLRRANGGVPAHGTAFAPGYGGAAHVLPHPQPQAQPHATGRQVHGAPVPRGRAGRPSRSTG